MGGLSLNLEDLYYGNSSMKLTKDSLMELSSILDGIDISGVELSTANLLNNAKGIVRNIMDGTVNDLISRLENTKNLIVESDQTAALLFSMLDGEYLTEMGEIDQNKLMLDMMSIVSKQDDFFNIADEYNDVILNYENKLNEINNQISIYNTNKKNYDVYSTTSWDYNLIKTSLEKINEANAKIPELENQRDALIQSMTMLKVLRDYSLESAYSLYTQYDDFEDVVFNGNKFSENYKYSEQLSYFTDEEVKIAKYLLNTDANDRLEQYFQLKQDVVNQRIGLELANEVMQKIINNDNNISTTALLAYEGFGDGIVNFFEGIKNLFVADGVLSPEQYKTSFLIQKLQEHYDEEQFMSLFTTATYEISNSIGNMTPSMLVSYITKNPKLGTTLMGLSAAGNAREQGLQSGMTNFESWMYGALSGSSEAVIGYFLGGIPGLNRIDEVAEIPGLKGYIAKLFMEGTEESTQSILEPVFASVAAYASGEKVDSIKIDWNDVLKSGIYGMITAGLLNGGQLVNSNNTAPTINFEIGDKLYNIDPKVGQKLIEKYDGQDLTDPKVLNKLQNDLEKYAINLNSDNSEAVIFGDAIDKSETSANQSNGLMPAGDLEASASSNPFRTLTSTDLETNQDSSNGLMPAGDLEASAPSNPFRTLTSTDLETNQDSSNGLMPAGDLEASAPSNPFRTLTSTDLETNQDSSNGLMPAGDLETSANQSNGLMPAGDLEASLIASSTGGLTYSLSSRVDGKLNDMSINDVESNSILSDDGVSSSNFETRLTEFDLSAVNSSDELVSLLFKSNSIKANEARDRSVLSDWLLKRKNGYRTLYSSPLDVKYDENILAAKGLVFEGGKVISGTPIIIEQQLPDGSVFKKKKYKFDMKTNEEMATRGKFDYRITMTNSNQITTDEIGTFLETFISEANKRNLNLRAKSFCGTDLFILYCDSSELLGTVSLLEDLKNSSKYGNLVSSAIEHFGPLKQFSASVGTDSYYGISMAHSESDMNRYSDIVSGKIKSNISGDYGGSFGNTFGGYIEDSILESTYIKLLDKYNGDVSKITENEFYDEMVKAHKKYMLGSESVSDDIPFWMNRRNYYEFIKTAANSNRKSVSGFESGVLSEVGVDFVHSNPLMEAGSSNPFRTLTNADLETNHDSSSVNDDIRLNNAEEDALWIESEDLNIDADSDYELRDGESLGDRIGLQFFGGNGINSVNEQSDYFYSALESANNMSEYGQFYTFEVQDFSAIPNDFWSKIKDHSAAYFRKDGRIYTFDEARALSSSSNDKSVMNYTISQIQSGIDAVDAVYGRNTAINQLFNYIRNGVTGDINLLSSVGDFRNIVSKIDYKTLVECYNSIVNSQSEVRTIKDEILEIMPQNIDAIAKIRFLYLELNKRVSYDYGYFSLERYSDEEQAYYSKNVTFENLTDNKVICRSWAQLYRELLLSAGFSEDIVKIRGYGPSGTHKWVEVDCGDFIIRADATDGFNHTIDLSTAKSGSATNGFIIIDKELAGVNINSKRDVEIIVDGEKMYQRKSVYDDLVVDDTWLRSIDTQLGYATNGRYFNEIVADLAVDFYSPSIVERIFGKKKEKVEKSKYDYFINLSIPSNMNAYDACVYLEQVKYILFGNTKKIQLYQYFKTNPNSFVPFGVTTILKTNDDGTIWCRIIDDQSGIFECTFNDIGHYVDYMKESGYY